MLEKKDYDTKIRPFDTEFYCGSFLYFSYFLFIIYFIFSFIFLLLLLFYTFILYFVFDIFQVRNKMYNKNIDNKSTKNNIK